MKKSASVLRSSVVLLLACIMILSSVCMPSQASAAAKGKGGKWVTKTRTFTTKKTLKRFLDNEIYPTNQKEAIKVLCFVLTPVPNSDKITKPLEKAKSISDAIAKKEKKKLMKWYAEAKKEGYIGLQIKYKVWKPAGKGPYYGNQLVSAKKRLPNVPD